MGLKILMRQLIEEFYLSTINIKKMSEIEYLQFKGIRKVHQLNKRFNLSIAEMIEFLQEYSNIKQREKTIRIVDINNNQKVAQIN